MSLFEFNLRGEFLWEAWRMFLGSHHRERVMFHPGLKERLLYAVFHSQQQNFFNRVTWPLSYQLCQLSVDFLRKKPLCWKSAMFLTPKQS